MFQPKAQVPAPSGNNPTPVANPPQPISDAKPLIQNLNPATTSPPQNTPNNYPVNPPAQTVASIPQPPLAAAPVNNPQMSNYAATMNPVNSNEQMHAYVSQEVADVQKSLKLIQLMYIAGGLVFFAVYALFWKKFFNIASPI